MAERIDEAEGPHVSKAPDPDDAVAHAPLEEGTDPLGDNASAYRRKGQFALACVLGVVFTVMAINDFTSGHAARGSLAALVALINAYVAVKEQAKPPRPRSEA